jgi:hypothetical protein
MLSRYKINRKGTWVCCPNAFFSFYTEGSLKSNFLIYRNKVISPESMILLSSPLKSR